MRVDNLRSLTLFLAVLSLPVHSSVAATPLPVSSPASQHPQQLERMHELVGGFIDDGKYAGAATMVVRNGKIVDWQSWGKASLRTNAPVEKDTIYRIYSLSKVITATAVLQLLEQNKLQLNQKVTDFIPEMQALRVYKNGTVDDIKHEEIKTPITIEMMLNHTAGFTYDFFNHSPVHSLYKKADLFNSESLDDFLGRVIELPLLAQPGEAFNYSISYDQLPVIIQRASGMKFEEYIRENITMPLKMSDTAYYVPKEEMHRLADIHFEKDGKLKAATKGIPHYADKGRGLNAGGAGMFSTIGDYARFAQYILNGGELDGKRILGEKTIALAMKNSLPEGSSAFIPSQGWGLMSGLFLDIPGETSPVSEGTFFWYGGSTTHFFADPAQNLIGLIFVQHVPMDAHGLFNPFRESVYQALD